MCQLKKVEKIFTSKFVGTGPSSYKKRIYRDAVSQRLRNTMLYNVCIAVLTLDAGLLARSQYQEALAIGHLDTGTSWFPCVYKKMLKWFPTSQDATTCFS